MERGVIFLLFWDEMIATCFLVWVLLLQKQRGDIFFAEFGLGLKVRRWVIKKWSFTSKIWCLFCWALLVCFCFLLLVIVAGVCEFLCLLQRCGGGEKADLHWKVYINDPRVTGPYILWENTVDGRNSAPVDIVDIPLKRNIIQTRMVIGNHPGMLRISQNF